MKTDIQTVHLVVTEQISDNGASDTTVQMTTPDSVNIVGLCTMTYTLITHICTIGKREGLADVEIVSLITNDVCKALNTNLKGDEVLPADMKTVRQAIDAEVTGAAEAVISYWLGALLEDLEQMADKKTFIDTVNQLTRVH